MVTVLLRLWKGSFVLATAIAVNAIVSKTAQVIAKIKLSCCGSMTNDVTQVSEGCQIIWDPVKIHQTVTDLCEMSYSCSYASNHLGRKLDAEITMGKALLSCGECHSKYE